MNYDVSKLISIIDEKNLSAISIDGFCGSGKTYLANYLKKEIYLYLGIFLQEERF